MRELSHQPSQQPSHPPGHQPRRRSGSTSRLPPDGRAAAALRPSLGALMAGLGGGVQAHALHPHQAPPTHAWSGEALVVVCLALSLGLYLVGALRLHRRSRQGRTRRLAEAAAFAAGWLVLAGALLSPLDALGSVYFSAHMIQHEVLMLAAAPLLVAGKPFGPWLWALPRRIRQGIGAGVRRSAFKSAWCWLTLPVSAWSLHALALWAWHLPRFFDAALRDDGWHSLQHASFLAAALLFWWSVIEDGRRNAQPGAALLSLFTTMLHTGALGALLTFSSRCWYLPYLAATGAAGGDPLADQQLGGLIMWIPGGMVYFGAGLHLAARWLACNARGPHAMSAAAGSPTAPADPARP